MNEGRELGRNKHIPGWLWREICSYQGQRQVGETGVNPSTLVVAKARRKLLKIRILRAFQFGAEVPCFRQAIVWRKRETLWVVWAAEQSGFWRHMDCTRSI